MSRLSTRRRDRTHTHTGVTSQSPSAPRLHGSLRRTNSNSTHAADSEYGSNENIHRSHLSLSEIREGSSTSLTRRLTDYKDSEDDLDESEGLTQLTEVHKCAIRSLRKIKYFVARRKFKEAFRPYDVKDVIEQYSAGHIDMLTRVKNLQSRLDLILGKAGSKKVDVYESKISLASRIVKVERTVEDIETKLDVMLDMYKEDRRWQLELHQKWLEQEQQFHQQDEQQHQPEEHRDEQPKQQHQHQHHSQQRNQEYVALQEPPSYTSETCGIQLAGQIPAPLADVPRIPFRRRAATSALPSGRAHRPPPISMPQFRLRSILVDKQQSEPNTPVVRNPSRPMYRNLSDLGPRIRKRVTYRCASVSSDEDVIAPLPSVHRKLMLGHAHAPFEPDIFEVVVPECEQEMEPGTHLWNAGCGPPETGEESRIRPEAAEQHLAPPTQDDALQPSLDGANIQLIISTCSESAQLTDVDDTTFGHGAESDCVSGVDDQSSSSDLIAYPNGESEASTATEGMPSTGPNLGGDDSTDLLLDTDFLTLS
ncbi:hypothetical protein LSH36_847g00032 [Paralvinella palmiformis]|uniref:Potassium channel voltage dependent KCNQ C-terminal domain-containing protein n=1 Tax=Paralvinella palmiformis TaxID=53620 RepID=A0AAD9MUE3_9ANNE|nr:hypothetical protein LSH36_847g00032 [Paralvinella palmiformis]